MSNTPLTYVKGFCYYIDKVRRIQAAISPVEDASLLLIVRATPERSFLIYLSMNNRVNESNTSSYS